MSTNVSGVSTNFFPTAQNGFTTTTSGSVTSGATSVGLNSVAGYTNGDTVVLVIDPTDASKKQTFTGVVDTSGSQITSVKWTAGTNQSHALGATVVDYETATHWALYSKGIGISHNPDGTLKDDAVTTDVIADATVSHEKLDATIAARAYLNSAQSINNGAARKVLLDTENFDLGSDFDTANSRFVAPVTGHYRITGQVGVANVDAAGNVCEAYIYVNGANYATGRSIAGGTSGSGNDPIATVSTLAPVTAGQYIELYALHDSATTSEALQTGTTVTFLSVEFAGV